MADPHLDGNVLSALQDVMEDEYPTLLETFLADSEARLVVLRKPGNAVQLIDAAHSFKGSSSNMGAARLAGLCHELEQCAKQGTALVIERLVAEIDREFTLVRPLYEAERQRSLSASATVRRF